MLEAVDNPRPEEPTILRPIRWGRQICLANAAVFGRIDLARWARDRSRLVSGTLSRHLRWGAA